MLCIICDSDNQKSKCIHLSKKRNLSLTILIYGWTSSVEPYKRKRNIVFGFHETSK